MQARALGSTRPFKKKKKQSKNKTEQPGRVPHPHLPFTLLITSLYANFVSSPLNPLKSGSRSKQSSRDQRPPTTQR